ncbi:MAG: hypothetical protein U5S82_20160 [Gammaproteobacteria bacterium]|nr:hypothetical protein [Gammaproteobacteria bacterium]
MKPTSRVVPLKDAVREQQSRYHLHPHQLDRLLAMQGKGMEASRRRTPPRGLMSAVAGMVLAFGLGWLAVWYSQPPAQSITELIADEVARNHLKLKPMEVRDDELPVLREYFDQLDFRPVDSPLLAANDIRLLGGRYCSLQGHIAAQLRFRTADGDRGTLYQARYDPEVFGPLPRRGQGETPITVEARGLAVTIWVEQGVVFAMTGASP